MSTARLALTLAVVAALGLVVPCLPTAAASLEETFQQAQAAFAANDFARAGALLEQAGDSLHRQGDAARAGMLWGNAAVARMKAEDYAGAASLYERILSASKQLPADQALRVHKNLVLCRAKLGQRALQITAIERMLKALPKLSSEERSDVYARQGDAYRAMELYGPAAASYDKAAYLLPQSGAHAVRAKILTAKGLCQGNLGDFTGAAKSLSLARKLAEVLNEPQTIAEADSNLGILHWERGDYVQAMTLLKGALATEEQAKLRRNQGVDNNNMGLVHKSVGKHQEAMRHFEDALAIARQVGNVRDEAIATVNRALLNRMAGQLKDARADYSAAIKLFEQCGFQEGMAGALLGVGKMAELEDRNYTLALENYEKALAVYEKLALPRGQAETILHLAGLYKRMAAPGRASRDLVFDDSPTVPDMAPDKALSRSRALYARALELAGQLQAKEMIWPAHQGLGWAELRQDKPEAALKHYLTAIDLVAKMHAALDSVTMLGEYMAGKEDLYGEAQEVCAALYKKTGDKKYLDLQLRFGETLRNEVQKASAALVQMNFQDVKKQALYERLNSLGREQAKAVKAMPVVAALPAAAGEEQKTRRQLAEKAAQEQRAKVQKLEEEYAQVLTEWKRQYPGDVVLFESSARVDVPLIQRHIAPEQVVLQYVTLPDRLLILAIASDRVGCVSVEVSKKNLEKLIRDDFLVGYLEQGYGRKSSFKQGEEEADLLAVCNTLENLYNLLIKPVEEDLAGKERLYIVSDGFLAQTPFGALVAGMENGQPRFLVEDYDIGYLRPSFVDMVARPAKLGSVKKMLAIANPENVNFNMGLLPGTIQEVKKANELIRASQIEKIIALEPKKRKEDPGITLQSLRKDFPELPMPPSKPTESWLREQLGKNHYEIIYFATHGMPYSDTYKNLLDFERTVKEGKALSPTKQKIKRLSESNLPSQSPLNGFLYLSSMEGDNIQEADIPPNRDGLLTMKEILELPDEAFAQTKYLVLSACNTGVTLAPKAMADGEAASAFTARQVEKIIADAGWIPGVDQVSFVETFMRKGISNVYATLWPANDEISSRLMAMFMENLVAQGENPDAIAAYSAAQRTLVSDGKAGRPVASGYPIPQHPFLWAVGAVFGK